jgi:Na+-driven multidrug efflux pump
MNTTVSVEKNRIDERQVSMIDRVFRLSLTSYFAANLITVLGSIIDGIIVGNTMGEEAITAVSFGSPIVIICSAIGTTISVGFQNQSLKSLSRGDREAAGKALTETLIIGVLISLVVIMLAFSYTGTIVNHLGLDNTDSSYLPCIEYIKGMILGLPAMTVQPDQGVKNREKSNS